MDVERRCREEVEMKLKVGHRSVDRNSEETNNSLLEYYSNNIRILTIRIRIRPFFRNE